MALTKRDLQVSKSSLETALTEADTLISRRKTADANVPDIGADTSKAETYIQNAITLIQKAQSQLKMAQRVVGKWTTID